MRKRKKTIAARRTTPEEHERILSERQRKRTQRRQQQMTLLQERGLGAGLLDIDEAAARLGVARHFLYSQTCRGPASQVPFVRVGRYIRFDPRALDEWLARNGSATTTRAK